MGACHAVALALVLACSCHRAEAAEAPTDAAAARAFLERWSEAARDGRLDETTREQFARAALSVDETQRDARSAEWLALARDAAPVPQELELAGDIEVQRAYDQHRAGHPSEAREMLRSAVAFLPRPSVSRYRAMVVLIDMCLEAGAFGEADAWDAERQRSLPAVERGADPADLLHVRLSAAHSHLTMCESLWLLDELPRALKEFDGLVAQSPEPMWRANAAIHHLNWLFCAKYFSDEEEFARSKLREGVFDAFPVHRGMAELRLGIACWYSGDKAEALAQFQRVSSEDGASALDRGQAETRSAEILFDDGEVEEARVHLARARELLGKLAAEALEERLFLAAVESRIDGVDLARMRATFQSFLDNLKTLPPSPASGVGFLASLRRREFLLQLLLAEMNAAPGEEGILAALEVLYRAQACSTLVRSEGGDPGDFRSFRARMLDDDSGLLLFFPGRRSGLVFAVDGRRVAVAETPSYLELERLRIELADWETRRPEDRSRQELLEVARPLVKELLPAPIVAQMRDWKEVTIVGRDLLGPFSCELLPLPSGALLGEEEAVGYLPSMPLGTLLAQRPSRSADQFALDLALITAPETRCPQAKGLRQIPFDARDRELLLGAFREDRVLVLQGAGATPRALRAKAADARAWLFVTHGILDEVHDTPRLVLSDADGSSGLLGSREVLELHAPPFVVVAACDSEAGTTRPGDDSVSYLGGGFLSAGTSVVILTPREIDYEVVVALLHELLRLVRSGEPPATALLEARRALRTARKSEDPALGLLHVIGLAHRPVF